MKKKNIKLIFSILLPLLIGVISALFSKSGIENYNTLPKPPLSPPAILFPIVWTILYILMGIAFYLILITEVPIAEKKQSIALYLFQLGMNFFWSLIFFKWSLYLFAFMWLVIMYIAVILCTGSFYAINKKAALIMVPYNLWMAAALYLNTAIVLMKYAA